MVKVPRLSRMAVVAGLGTVALLVGATSSASAAPAPTPRAAVQAISAPRAAPSRAMLRLHRASPANPNCTYAITQNTSMLTTTGQWRSLFTGDLMWGPQPQPGAQTVYLYSLVWQEWGYVYPDVLFEEYCDP